MSIKVMSSVWEHSQQKEGALLVLLALADCAHDDGSMAFPSVKTLARKGRLSTRAVQYALRKLEADGEIERTGTHESGVAIYRVILGVQNLRGGAKSAPGAKSAGGCNLEQIGGAKSAPKSLRIEPSIYIPEIFDTSADESEQTRTKAKPGKRAGAMREKDQPYWQDARRCGLFENYWTKHPRKVAKENALRAWREALGDSDSSEVVMKSFYERFHHDLKAWKVAKEERFIPHFATWINRRDWEPAQ